MIKVEPTGTRRFTLTLGDIVLHGCTLTAGPADLPDVRLPPRVSLAPHLFTAVRRRAVAAMGAEGQEVRRCIS